MITCLFWLFASTIVSVFLGEGSEAFALATEGLPLYSLGFVLIAFNMSVIGYFQSMEKSGRAIVLMTLRGFVFVILFFRFLPALIGEIGLWLAVPAGEFLTAVVAAVFLSTWRGSYR